MSIRAKQSMLKCRRINQYSTKFMSYILLEKNNDMPAYGRKDDLNKSKRPNQFGFVREKVEALERIQAMRMAWINTPSLCWNAKDFLYVTADTLEF